MSDYRNQVEEALQAIVVDSATSYWWFGKRSPQLSAGVRRLLPRNTARNYLLFNLQRQLYNDFYCRGFASTFGQPTARLPVESKKPFVEQLSFANSGLGYWADGWEVHGIQDSEVIAHRAGLDLRVRPEDCLIPEGASIATAPRLRLRFPKESLAILPGFYMAHGNEELITDASQVIVRFYWNLTAAGAIRLMKRTTVMLNREQIPFNLKVLNDERSYSRCDAAVLYTRKGDYQALAEILGRIHHDVSGHLKRAIPVFTKWLAPGVGLAEDPGQGSSFGEHRCRLLADGIIHAYEQRKISLQEKVQVVAEHFAQAGVDLEKPFLNSGSSDDYLFQPPRRQPRNSRDVRIASRADFNAEVFLKTAGTIASRLSKEAVWYGDRCNWLGAKPTDFGLADRQPERSHRALAPELYAGTSGVGLFLAEFCAATGDVAARRTALGAIGQALSRVDTLPHSSRLGLFTGAFGIAFAAARVGTSLADEGLLEQAAGVLHELAREELQVREFDLISGAAGAIAGLVILRDILNDESLLDFAVRLAGYVLQAADKSDVGYSWRSLAFPKQRNLTGFAHGAAGVGYALLELFHATGETEYRIGAERAFAYERHWFDDKVGNWPDFREDPGQRRGSRAPRSCAVLWCHGAPGIALSRLRALQILNDDTCKREAIAALQTTRKTIRRWLQSGTENYSLCHGLAGNAEVLLYGGQVLGQESTEDRKLIAEVANVGLEMYAKREGQWPCGTGGEETPGLMLGLAGIGHFYLRLHTPKTPSILMLQREGF